MVIQQQIQMQRGEKSGISSAGEKRKEFDGGEWERKCKDDYATLSRQARESVKRTKVEEEEQQQQNEEVNSNQVIMEDGLGNEEGMLIDEIIVIESSQDEALTS